VQLVPTAGFPPGPPFPVNLVVTSAVQPGGPDTAWTIDADIPPFSLFTSTLYNLTIIDSSGPPTVFAQLDGAFGADVPANPSQPIPDVWVPEWRVLSTGGASPTPRWDQALAAGPNSNGNNAYFQLNDELYLSMVGTPLPDPTQPPPNAGPFMLKPPAGIIQRSGLTPATGVFETIGPAIWEWNNTQGGVGFWIHLRAVAGFNTVGVPVGPNGLQVLEEIWTFNSNTWARVETIANSTPGDLLQFVGIGDEIFLQAQADATNQRGWRARIDYFAQEGYVGS